MKGSSVDRRVLDRSDAEKIRKGLQSNEGTDSKLILKDVDFVDLGMKFKLSKKDCAALQSFVASDSELLKTHKLTDYSLLVTIHTFNKEDYEKAYKNPRIMKSYDNKYLYNFSIIDFLTVSSYDKYLF